MKALFFDDDKKIYHRYNDIYEHYNEIHDIKILNDMIFEAKYKKDGVEKKLDGIFMTDDLYYEITKKGYKKHLTDYDDMFLTYYNYGSFFFKLSTKIKRFLKDKLETFFHAAILNQKVVINYSYYDMIKRAEIEYKKTLKELDEIKKKSQRIK